MLDRVDSAEEELRGLRQEMVDALEEVINAAILFGIMAGGAEAE